NGLLFAYEATAMSIVLIALLVSSMEQVLSGMPSESVVTSVGTQQRVPATDSQSQAAPQRENSPSTSNVKADEEALKQKDLYEASGYLHPFRRMPRFVLVDQKRIWT